MTSTLRPGDFTGLASDYSRYRPGYAESVLKAIRGLLPHPPANVDFVDVGAGTGIWTRMVYHSGVRSVIAVEPNDEMRANGVAQSKGMKIRWVAGNAAQTGLPDGSCDWLSMASSFHWTDFEDATAEFYRVLRPGGQFTAIWNPRLFEANPVLADIEDHLRTRYPDVRRVSSGRSGITDTLTERLWSSQYFDDVVYVEGRHEVAMTPEQYLGAWRSVNDLRVQLGRIHFEAFMAFVEQRIAGVDVIQATYLTRAWSARRK